METDKYALDKSQAAYIIVSIPNAIPVSSAILRSTKRSVGCCKNRLNRSPSDITTSIVTEHKFLAVLRQVFLANHVIDTKNTTFNQTLKSLY